MEREVGPDEKPEMQADPAQGGGSQPPTAVGTQYSDDGDDGREIALEDIDLGMRAYNVLRRSGLVTVGKIFEKSEEEVRSLRNLGTKSFLELRERLDELGILPIDAAWDSRRM